MISKTLIYSLIVAILVSNCFVGTQRDACRYELKKKENIECDPATYSIFLTPTKDGNYENDAFVINSLLFSCFLYLEKLKSCDDDNNRFKPGFFGLNQFYFKKSKFFNKIYSMNTEFNLKEKKPSVTVSSEVLSSAATLADQTGHWARGREVRSLWKGIL
jgi:hypothetical protein